MSHADVGHRAAERAVRAEERARRAEAMAARAHEQGDEELSRTLLRFAEFHRQALELQRQHEEEGRAEAAAGRDRTPSASARPPRPLL